MTLANKNGNPSLDQTEKGAEGIDEGLDTYIPRLLNYK